MRKASVLLMWLATFVLILAMSYGFALLGEPQAVWLWSDMLGVL